MAVETKSSVELNPALLPDYQAWQHAQTHEFTLWNYLDVRGDYELAAAFSKLFCPDFVEVDGYVFLAEQFDHANFEQWRQQFADDRKSVEAVINHVHIDDLFNNGSRADYQPELVEYLGRVLVVCWRRALQELFPPRQFTFECSAQPDEAGPTITFFQAE